MSIPQPSASFRDVYSLGKEARKTVLSFKVKTDSHCLKSLKIVSFDILGPKFYLNIYPFLLGQILGKLHIFIPFLLGQIWGKLDWFELCTVYYEPANFALVRLELIVF